MKILHIAHGLIVNSGISVFVAEIAGAQAEIGHEVYVRYKRRPDYPVSTKVDSSPYKRPDEYDFVPDIVHIHALWLLDMVRAMNWCRRRGIPYVVSPHGGLMPRVFSKGRLKKRMFYSLFLKKNLQCANAIHCTGDGEVAAVKKLGIQARTFISPLGCHLPEWPVKRMPSTKRTILFLSRIGEEKGLTYLLDAWRSVPHENWRLVIAGPDWKGHLDVLKSKIATEGIRDVEFPGLADGELKDRLYRRADLFVLSSPMENFSMVVLDALAYGVPVVCTKGTPWRAIEERRCGWWVDPNSSIAIATALQSAMNMPADEYNRLSCNARMLAESFDWKKIGSRLVESYESVMGG